MLNSPDLFTKRLLVTTLLILGLMLAWFTSDILLLAFAGILLGILLHGLAQLLSRLTHLPERLALTFIILIFLFCFTALGWFISPNLSAQASQIQVQWPQLLGGVKQQLSHVHGGEWLYDQLYKAVVHVTARHFATQNSDLFIETIGIAGSALVVIFLSLYIAYNPQLYVSGILHLVPPSHRYRGLQLLGAVGTALFRWVVGRLVGMVLLGVILGLGLWLLGINLPISLALVAAILDFVPYLGPILATLPAVLVALLQSPSQVLYVLALYVLALHLEGYVIEPFIEKKAVYLPPALTLIAQLLMYQLFGLLGMFLAMPLIATLYTAVRMVYVEDILGDRLKDE